MEKLNAEHLYCEKKVRTQLCKMKPPLASTADATLDGRETELQETLQRLKECVESAQYFEALQQYQSLAQRRKQAASKILSHGASEFLKKRQEKEGLELGILLIDHLNHHDTAGEQARGLVLHHLQNLFQHPALLVLLKSVKVAHIRMSFWKIKHVLKKFACNSELEDPITDILAVSESFQQAGHAMQQSHFRFLRDAVRWSQSNSGLQDGTKLQGDPRLHQRLACVCEVRPRRCGLACGHEAQCLWLYALKK
jgi:hypothetical protein